MPILYTQNNCKWCGYVKNFLDREGIEYEVRNIDTDDKYKSEVEDMGYMSVPVLKVGEQTVSGFKPADIMKIINA